MLSIVPYLIRLKVKSRMEYRGAFLLSIFAMFFSYACGYTAIWVLLARFGTLGGWTWPELAFLFSFQLLTYALGAAVSFVQFRDMEQLIRLGTIDALLTRPVGTWTYLAFSGFNIDYAGHIVLATGLMAWSTSQLGAGWEALSTFYLVTAILSAAAVNAAIITMIGACAFILVQSHYLYSIFFGFWELSRYPLSIFPSGLQWLLLSLIPLGLASYVPVAQILGKDIVVLGDWGGTLALLAGPILVLVAMAQWRFALSRYQGAGG